MLDTLFYGIIISIKLKFKKENLIIIVNDNDQSIAENHGGLYKNLKELRETDGKSANNIFKSFGLDYKYLDDGHNVEKLVELFQSVKDINHPIVLHIHTIKGKGLPYAEKNREAWHAGGPFNIEDGSPKFEFPKGNTTLFDSLKELLDTNPKAVVLNAGTPMGLGFVKGVREEYAERGHSLIFGGMKKGMLGGIVRGMNGNKDSHIIAVIPELFDNVKKQDMYEYCNKVI